MHHGVDIVKALHQNIKKQLKDLKELLILQLLMHQIKELMYKYKDILLLNFM